MLSFFFIKSKSKEKSIKGSNLKIIGKNRRASRKAYGQLLKYYTKNKVGIVFQNADFEINIVNLAKVFARHGKRQKMVLAFFKILYVIQSMFRKRNVGARVKKKIGQLALSFSLYRPPVRKHLRKSPTRTVFKKAALRLRKRFYLGTRFLLQAVVSLRKKLKCNLIVAIFLEFYRVLYRTKKSTTFRGLRRFMHQTARLKIYDHMFYIRTRRQKEKERKNRLAKKRSRWLKR